MQHKDEKIPVIAIVGPTASGKTRLSVALAERFGTEIISADSMQIYRGMQIATAKPTPAEMKNVPHHLVDFAPMEKRFSVAEYVSLAKAAAEKIYRQKKVPIVCGGTGLYVDSLLSNLKYLETPANYALRGYLKKHAEEFGGQALLERLRKFDPISAEKLHPNDLTRIIRAIEIYETTGQTMQQQLAYSRSQGPLYDACKIGLFFENRDELYQRINDRVDKMLELGLVQEAKGVLASNYSATAMNAIGYKELKPYFDGEISLDDAIEKIKMQTRRYAKRQLTWFRRDKNINWIDLSKHSLEAAVDIAAEIIENHFSL